MQKTVYVTVKLVIDMPESTAKPDDAVELVIQEMDYNFNYDENDVTIIDAEIYDSSETFT